MTTITVAELKEQYAILPVKTYGKCIIIPIDEFTDACQLALAAESLEWYPDKLDGKPIIFVPVNEEIECKGRHKKEVL